MQGSWTYSGKGESGQRHGAEQILAKPRELEVQIAKGLTAGEAARKEGSTGQTCFRWWKECGGSKGWPGQASQGVGDGARAAPKIVVDLPRDKGMLEEVARGNF